ncbi:MAG: mechanosensitive ion channel family protein [Bacteroidia bacterium]|nr:mechanosensitive ion channel family protein [Bacteroidia bacterium]
METSAITQQLLAFIYVFGPRLIGSILVFVIGLYLINWVSKFAAKGLKKNGLDVSLQSFLSSMIGVALKIMLLITVAGMLGIQTTSFVAVIGALGLAVGLALQGSLSNFAGGVLILVFKPFKVGDLIESQGQSGVVTEIQIFNTILLTPDHKTIILANGAVSNATIINYSKQGSLRVDLKTSVAADTDITKAKEILIEVCKNFEEVLNLPLPEVDVLSTEDGMVVFTVRPFTEVENYWKVHFGITEKIKEAFDKHGIKKPIPTSIQFSKEL